MALPVQTPSLRTPPRKMSAEVPKPNSSLLEFPHRVHAMRPLHLEAFIRTNDGECRFGVYHDIITKLLQSQRFLIMKTRCDGWETYTDQDRSVRNPCRLAWLICFLDRWSCRVTIHESDQLPACFLPCVDRCLHVSAGKGRTIGIHRNGTCRRRQFPSCADGNIGGDSRKG